ncbi:hypothetical protein [Hymenobacter arizonensis]|uniref:Uncharacterized protein n=1 Tax=Hymenobacter arizonensis TaxID=1227077 RepID=A0A1I6BN54_HYMAR|nr:hypothetical protein [Hymenobacter arizonensis]SFQ82362.1 hypothetical protein SAMN04515668_4794 [Hymenobacter arizonensis]
MNFLAKSRRRADRWWTGRVLRTPGLYWVEAAARRVAGPRAVWDGWDVRPWPATALWLALTAGLSALCAGWFFLFPDLPLEHQTPGRNALWRVLARGLNHADNPYAAAHELDGWRLAVSAGYNAVVGGCYTRRLRQSPTSFRETLRVAMLIGHLVFFHAWPFFFLLYLMGPKDPTDAGLFDDF